MNVAPYHLHPTNKMNYRLITPIKGQNHEVNQSAEKCENKVDSKVMHTSGPAKGESDSDKQQRVLTEADVLQLQDALKKARAELRKYEGRL